MFNSIDVKSASGDYTVNSLSSVNEVLSVVLELQPKAIVLDNNVSVLWGLVDKLCLENIILIDPSEESKEYSSVEFLIAKFLEVDLKKHDTVVAIGGGIVQDVTAFVSSIYFRGIDWIFVPTTLLAQADSCIGSKTSINFQGKKNMLGGFYPPRQILHSTEWLNTLSEQDFRSGCGEIIKAHIIGGDHEFSVEDWSRDKPAALEEAVWTSLTIKKEFIEVDEFDLGVRRIFNYGHTFGHALEAASKFLIPHGLAVTMGMLIANRVSACNEYCPHHKVERLNKRIMQNLSDSDYSVVELEAFFSALQNDKKNTNGSFKFVLPKGNDLKLEICSFSVHENVQRVVEESLRELGCFDVH